MREVYDVGDMAYYPDIGEVSERQMKVVDREVCRYKKSGKIFVRYLFDETLMDYLVEDMHDCIENEYDVVMCIEGKEGSGKSQLAYQICKRYDPEFNIEESYVYDFDIFLKKLTEAGEEDRGKIWWMDEATAVANARQAMTRQNIAFTQMLEMMRSRGWVLVMCIPSLDRLDVYVREYRIRYRLTALEKSWDVVNTEPRRGFYELQFKRGRGPNQFRTVGYGTFGVMTPEERAIYDRVKRGSQKTKIDQIADTMVKKPREKNQVKLGEAFLVLKEMGLSTKEIAERVGYDPQSVRNRIAEARNRKKEAEEVDD